jgi:hypothetical protein
MTHLIAYNEALEEIKTTLIALKKSLDTYKESPNANPQAVEVREKQLISIAHFVKAANLTVESLDYEITDAFKRGFEQAKRQSQTDYVNIRGAVGDYALLAEIHPEVVKKFKKEAIRKNINYFQKKKWNDHL